MKGDKKMELPLKTVLFASALAAVAAPALAQSQGDIHLGIGVSGVFPKSDNGTLASTLELDIDEGYAASFTVEYFFRDNIGIELLAATQFEHDYELNGTDFGDFKLLPPTLSVNYHFQTGTAWKPYVGAGVTYAYVSDESPSPISIDNAWGFGVQAGIDYAISETGSVRFNARYIDVETDVKLNGVKIGEADVDPFVLTAAYVFRF